MTSESHIALKAVAAVLAITCCGTFLHAAITFIPVAGRVDSVFDDQRHVLYITAGSSVQRYDLQSHTFLSALALGGTLRGIDISPDHTTLAVADGATSGGNNWVHLYNLVTNTDTKVMFPLAFAEGGTYSAAYASDGRLLVTSSFNGSGWTPLRRYDPATATITNLATLSSPAMVSASADRQTVAYTEADISSGPSGKYLVSDGLAHAGAGTGWFTFEIATSRNGSQFAVPTYGGTYIYDQSFNYLTKLGTYASNGPTGAAYSPNSDIVYFSWWGSSEVRAFRTDTFQQVGTYNTGHTFNWNGNGAFGEGRTRISADGTLLSTTVDDGIAIIDVPEPVSATSVIVGSAAIIISRRRAR